MKVIIFDYFMIIILYVTSIQMVYMNGNVIIGSYDILCVYQGNGALRLAKQHSQVDLKSKP